eukprot:TRINITY_DN22533_c0_g1_i1.p1 TRINITY_DN22533_c0_g1~~TRINITY_DN22533_c0_g1_i1.p1  ORF type:complete len:497 (-),score=116.27 TRINITY_DN22533_c0_g1_i1:276-1766(-)
MMTAEDSMRSSGAPGDPNPAAQLLIQDLLARPPSEVAAWALEQAQSLNRPDVDVAQNPLFQVAGAFSSVSTEQKQALIHGVMAGYGELPRERRAEAVRLAMQTHSLMQQSQSAQSKRPEDDDGAAGGAAAVREAPKRGRSGDIVEAQPLMRDQNASFNCNGAASPPGNSGGGSSGSRPPKAKPPPSHLAQNLLMVVHNARLDKMSKQETMDVMQVAQHEVAHLAQPQQLLDVVSELNADEREQLTETLVEAHVVPEEQRGVLEEAVRPGGYADKLALAMAWLERAKSYAWVALALPGAELVIGILTGSLSCGAPLAAWLRYDGVVALCGAGAMAFSAHTLAPVYQTLSADPIGVVQRWQTAPESYSWKTRLSVAVPGTQFELYRTGAIGVIAAVAFVILGAVGAVIALFEWLASLALGCNGLVLLVGLAFIVLRLGLVVAMVLLLFFVLDELQKHRSRAPRLSSSLNPSFEDNSHDPLLPQNYSPSPAPRGRDDFV